MSLTNMLEETVEVLPAVNKVELEFKPFEIKTIKVENTNIWTRLRDEGGKK